MDNKLTSLLLLFLISLTHQELNPGCECLIYSATYGKEYGRFSSPDYPKPYPNDINCLLYTFIAGSSEVVEINIRNFDLHPHASDCSSGDYLRVYLDLEAAHLTDLSQATGVLCSALPSIPQLLYSSGPFLVLELHTSSHPRNFNYSGFLGTFRFIDTSRYTMGGGDYGGCDYQIFETSAFGHLYSPRYPSSYPRNTHCSYTLTAKEGGRVRILFQEFDLQRGDHSCLTREDVIRVHDGRGPLAPVITLLCNQGPNYEIISSSESLFLEFTSTSHWPGRGFHAKYLFLPPPQENSFDDGSSKFGPAVSATRSSCDVKLTSESSVNGSITSPGFPGPYPPKSTCQYEFLATGRQRVQLVFTDFSLFSKHPVPKDCEGVDRVIAYVILDERIEKIDSYCGVDVPRPIMSNGPRLLITFHGIHSAMHARGFRAKYHFTNTKTGLRSLTELLFVLKEDFHNFFANCKKSGVFDTLVDESIFRIEAIKYAGSGGAPTPSTSSPILPPLGRLHATTPPSESELRHQAEALEEALPDADVWTVEPGTEDPVLVDLSDELAAADTEPALIFDQEEIETEHRRQEQEEAAALEEALAQHSSGGLLILDVESDTNPASAVWGTDPHCVSILQKNPSDFTAADRTKLLRTIATNLILSAQAENKTLKLEDLDSWGGYISSAPEVAGSPYFRREVVFSWHYKPRRGSAAPRTEDSELLRIVTSREAKGTLHTAYKSVRNTLRASGRLVSAIRSSRSSQGSTPSESDAESIDPQTPPVPKKRTRISSRLDSVKRVTPHQDPTKQVDHFAVATTPEAEAAATELRGIQSSDDINEIKRLWELSRPARFKDICDHRNPVSTYFLEQYVFLHDAQLYHSLVEADVDVVSPPVPDRLNRLSEVDLKQTLLSYLKGIRAEAVKAITKVRDPALKKGLDKLYSNSIDNFGISGGEQVEDYPCAFRYRAKVATRGYFTSPNFPGLYPRETECHYFFHGEQNHQVLIVFQYFDVEGVTPCDATSASDYVEFSNFMGLDRKYTRRCGQLVGGPSVVSEKKFFRVTFRSNDRLDATGFNASYEFVEMPTSPPTTPRPSAAPKHGIHNSAVLLALVCLASRSKWR